MEQTEAVVVRTTSQRSRADEWALVLAAEGLAASIHPLPEGFALCVPGRQLERALVALDAYESENPARPAPVPAEAPLRSGSATGAGLAAGAAMLLFFAFVRSGLAPWPWLERGAADAARIQDGELWRAFTALTLHADLPHVAANALVGGVFVTAACRSLGPGLGLALSVLSGALGNLANALAHGSTHVSVGASTAVFGALGLLAGIAVRRRHRAGARGPRPWAPVAAGLGLLAMLGTGGPRVDLWAHLLGLLAGALLGLAAAPLASRPPGALGQTLWAVGTALALLAAWHAALSA